MEKKKENLSIIMIGETEILHVIIKTIKNMVDV